MQAGALLAGMIAAAAPAPGAVPDAAEAGDALTRHLNAACDAPGRSCPHPPSYHARAMSCAPEEPHAALCRLEVAHRSFYAQNRRSRWTPATVRFVRAGAGAEWSVGEIFQPVPNPAELAGALAWEQGRTCRLLIDHCADENGNSPDARVSLGEIACRPLRRGRAACTFTARQFISGQDAPSRRCTGTLRRRGIDAGGMWEFEPAGRRNDRGRLSCN